MSLFYQIPQSHVIVIERLGKFNKVMESGLRVKLPFIDQPKDMSKWEGFATKKHNNRDILIELSEQAMDTNPRTAITKDNVQIKVDAIIYWQIINVNKSIYEVDYLPKAILDLSLTSLRSIIGSMTFDESISNRSHINNSILSELNDVSTKWGVKVNRVEIQELNASDEAASAMLKQMTAEREKRAAILEAEGKKQAQILEAEGLKQSLILKAQGEAEALELLARGESEFLEAFKVNNDSEKAINLFLSLKYFQSLEKMGDSSKVFLPLEAGKMIELLKNLGSSK